MESAWLLDYSANPQRALLYWDTLKFAMNGFWEHHCNSVPSNGVWKLQWPNATPSTSWHAACKSVCSLRWIELSDNPKSKCQCFSPSNHPSCAGSKSLMAILSMIFDISFTLWGRSFTPSCWWHSWAIWKISTLNLFFFPLVKIIEIFLSSRCR